MLLLTLLCELEYSSGIVPKDRLSLDEGRARALFESTFRNDEILALKSKPVYVKNVLTTDADGKIVETSYRSTRVLTLIKLDGRP